MTKEEILAMQPGCKLDELVAEKIMGAPNNDFWFVMQDTRCYDRDGNATSWKPSTDISAALEVVEKFPVVNISRVEVFEKSPHHAVEIFFDMETNEPSRAEAPSAPEAICKAALLAVMEGTDEG